MQHPLKPPEPLFVLPEPPFINNNRYSYTNVKQTKKQLSFYKLTAKSPNHRF